jgi:hypothetical protein
MVALARPKHPVLPDNAGQRDSMPATLPLFSFKLRCLKLFDHDKINAFPAGPGARSMGAGKDYVEE